MMPLSPAAGSAEGGDAEGHFDSWMPAHEEEHQHQEEEGVTCEKIGEEGATGEAAEDKDATADSEAVVGGHEA